MHCLTIAAAALLVSLSAFAEDKPAVAGPHPFFKDEGALGWFRKLEDAQHAAAAADKLIFIEFGREDCPNCRTLCTSILPDARIRTRLSALAVGLAADCDKPEGSVERLLLSNLGAIHGLPYVGIVTADLQWIGGWSGSRTIDEVAQSIDEIEHHPALQAAPPVVKQLETAVAQARKAADRADWKAVLKASREAGRLKGRSSLRTSFDTLVASAVTWGGRELDAVVAAVLDGADLVEAKRRLGTTHGALAGEPVADDARSGIKALERLAAIRALEAGPTPDRGTAHRTRAEFDFKGTRWEALFRPR